MFVCFKLTRFEVWFVLNAGNRTFDISRGQTKLNQIWSLIRITCGESQIWHLSRSNQTERDLEFDSYYTRGIADLTSLEVKPNWTRFGVWFVLHAGNRRFNVSRGQNHTMYDFDSSRAVRLVLRVGNRRFYISRSQNHTMYDFGYSRYVWLVIWVGNRRYDELSQIQIHKCKYTNT